MAPPTSALAVANELRAELLAAGVPQVSIELMIGRSGLWVSTGGFNGVSFVANLGHHIASRPSASNPTPGLAVVKQGRPGIPAPLCNGYGGMDLIARIICLDWANHPGEGGPWTLDGYTIPRDGGRPYLFGWEHEGGYSTAVWDATYTNRATGARMTYREFMGRCHAGTLRWLGRPRTSHGEHKTWADLKQVGRKIDRLGYTRTSGISELTPYYSSPTQEDDVELTDRIALKSDAQVKFSTTTTTVAGALSSSLYYAVLNRNHLLQHRAALAALEAKVDAISAGNGTSAEELAAITAAAKAGADAALTERIEDARVELVVDDDEPPA